MSRERALQASLVALAVVVAAVGIATMSLKKAAATYGFGVVGIAGIILPDWEFFDRDFSQWFTPMPGRRRSAAGGVPAAMRFKFHPLRVAVLGTIYCFGLYKWWLHVTN